MKIAIVSGYFNPLHVGHLDYLQAARELADKLLVIINNDYQVTLKGSVLGTLKHVLVQNQANGRNHFMFCNGGDRSNTNTPEERLCSSNSYNLTSVYNVGGEKRQSSSDIISKAAKKDGVSEI